jgi:uncharacterized protein with HEPN domain
MSMIDNVTRLCHMRDAAVEAIGFIRDRTRLDLERDRMLTLALVKDIEIIGEAAGRISSDCKNKYPAIPWIQMVGMRNRLTHAYFEIDLDIVWEVVANDLPPNRTRKDNSA